jgi:hypothetical protein
LKNIYVALAGMALAISAVPLAAQTYQYTGKPFTLFSCGPTSAGNATLDCPSPAPGNPLTSYTATDHVTATLTFDAPLPAGLVSENVKLLPGFKLTMNDGHQTLSAPPAPGVIASVSTDASGQIIAPWVLVINLGNAANSGISTQTNADIGALACCDPQVQGDLGLVLNMPGTWGNAQKTPAQMVTDLISVVQQMNIPKQGTSLTDKLQRIANDIETQNGLACPDLVAFSNQVKAQKGKTVTAAQATQLLTAVAAIQAALGCGV